MDDVLQQWAGLGYYSRARNLHRAAKEIVARHSGEFPRVWKTRWRCPASAATPPLPCSASPTARRMPSSTAMSPASWRAWARFAAICAGRAAGARSRGSGRAASGAGSSAQRRPASNPGDWNQAMMELGATICTPRAPRCGACPVSRWCRAHALGIALRLPSPRRKPKSVRLALSAAVLLDPRGRTLLVRQKSGHSALILEPMAFPLGAVARSAIARRTIRSPAPEKLAAYLRSEFGITTALEPLPPARHTVTFRIILPRAVF